MNPQSAARTRALTRGLIAVASAAALALAGCDNPACVFGGDCSKDDPEGALGTLSASAPEDGQVLLAVAPRVERAVPTGDNVDPETPIAIVFSEAMSPANLSAAFELERVGFGALPLQAVTLVGDGRLLVLYPLQALAGGADYEVRFREGVRIGDRLGQQLIQPADGVVVAFHVGEEPPVNPRVLLSYPDGDETALPATSEIAVVFSRKMNAGTVTDAAFEVEVEGDAPEFDALPQAVSLGGFANDTRVFRWISLDGTGARAELGLAADVSVRLSPPGARIEDASVEAHELALTTFGFRTLGFSAPAAASITSIPDDAIGIDQIDGPADLAVRVDLDDARDGDRLAAFVFGVQPEDVEAPLTIALLREVLIEGTPASFTFTAFELDLVKSVSPLQARLRDGTIALAFRIQRGNLTSPVRLLDVDLGEDGAQGPLLDTQKPQLLGLGTSGTSLSSFRTDLRDATLVGRANEPVRGALVTTTLGDNELRRNAVPPAVGADDETGLFIAAPVRVGLLTADDQPLSYSIRVYDRALNASGIASGTLRQRGAGASGSARPFKSVLVEVFDAYTLAAIAGASVFAHEEVDGEVFDLEGPFTTLSDGTAIVSPALVGATIVSVRAPGYDLFTFDGVPTDRVSIPLRPIGAGTAQLSGTATSLDPAVNAYARNVADTRFLEPGASLAGVNACSFDTTDARFECGFGPVAFQAREIGALTGFTSLTPPSVLLWTAPTFLKGFGLRIPMTDVAAGGTQNNTLLAIDRLDAPTLPAEELPLDIAPHVLSTAAFLGLTTDPLVRVEAIVPGLRGPLTVGLGAAFGEGLPPSTFAVRAAIPGVADPDAGPGADLVGELVAQGTIEPELYLRAEAVATTGARSAERKRLSATDSTLTIPAEPVLGATPLALNPGGVALDLAFVDVLPDALGAPGIHRATLTDAAGRRWTIWKLDPADASGAEVVAYLPLLGGSYPLAGTSAGIQISSWSYEAFDPQSFLWTDIERLAERFAHSASVSVEIP